MSVERSFEAWEEVQRHGQDLADRLAQGFNGLIQSHITNPPSFSWPNPQSSKLFELEFPGSGFNQRDSFGVIRDSNNVGIHGVSTIFDIGNRIGQAGIELGSCLNGLVEQFFRRLPVPFKHEESVGVAVRLDGVRRDVGVVGLEGELGQLSERLKGFGFVENDKSGDGEGMEGVVEEAIGVGGFDLKSVGFLGKSQMVDRFPSLLSDVNFAGLD